MPSKKWDGKPPDRIKGQVRKNSYENGGIKAPDTGALKVKQYINATKSKNKIAKDLFISCSKLLHSWWGKHVMWGYFTKKQSKGWNYWTLYESSVRLQSTSVSFLLPTEGTLVIFELT